MWDIFCSPLYPKLPWLMTGEVFLLEVSGASLLLGSLLRGSRSFLVGIVGMEDEDKVG